MGNTTSGTQRVQRHADRLAWLLARPALLARLPSAGDDVEPAQSDALLEAQRAMMLVRLYAPTSETTNVRWGIRLLVSELRGQHVNGKGPTV